MDDNFCMDKKTVSNSDLLTEEQASTLERFLNAHTQEFNEFCSDDQEIPFSQAKDFANDIVLRIRVCPRGTAE